MCERLLSGFGLESKFQRVGLIEFGNWNFGEITVIEIVIERLAYVKM